MVTLSTVVASNALISSTLPAGLVAVFVGATSGIGEITLKKFARYSIKPRVYFIGRSQEAANRIKGECQALNPSGEYIFRQADVSLIRVVDEVCKEIKAKEKSLNLLFLSAGVASMDRSETSEHLHLLTALNYYSRVRFITNLLPLLHTSTSLRRVVTVGGGGLEGAIDATDFPALRVPLPNLRGHLCTLVTLGFEAVAKTAPDVSFVHNYPGTVETGLWRGTDGPPGGLANATNRVPIDECGKRQLYLSTSARFPPLKEGSAAIRLGDGTEVALGVNGELGSGVYSVGWDCEAASAEVRELLAGLREKGMVEAVREHTQKELKRITE